MSRGVSKNSWRLIVDSVSRLLRYNRETGWSRTRVSRQCIQISVCGPEVLGHIRRMSSLRSRLDIIAVQFASAVLAELKRARIEDFVVMGGERTRAPASLGPSTLTRAPARRAKGRLRRRTQAELEAAVASVVSTLRKGPLRAEQIRQALKMDRRELPRVIAMALASKQVSKKGRKRATVYTARK